MICSQCSKEMVNLGNVTGIILTSWPVQWDDTYVCHECKIRKNVRVSGSTGPDYTFLGSYKTL
jgi:hypothetical protein